jgi:hypothetical protein
MSEFSKAQARVAELFQESAALKATLATQLPAAITAAGDRITTALLNGNKIMSCGNGGSAGDAQHFSGEMLGVACRPAVPAAHYFVPIKQGGGYAVTGGGNGGWQLCRQGGF